MREKTKAICLVVVLGIALSVLWNSIGGPSAGPYLIPPSAATASTNGATINGIAFIAQTGSDVTGTGSTLLPFATLTNAAAKLNNKGTIYVRGGNYTNQFFTGAGAAGLTIRGYNEVTPSRFWGGLFVSSNSFVASTNGLWTNTPSAAFSNAITYGLQNTLPNGFAVPCPLYQLFTAYGGQGSNYLYQPPFQLGQPAITNRCMHWPILSALSYTNPTTIINSNGFFAWTNGILWVKFASSNVICDVMLPSTNTSLISGCDALTDITVRNLQVFGYGTAFDFSLADRAVLEMNYIDASMLRNINVNNSAREITLRNNEITGSFGNNVDFNGNYGDRPTIVIMEGNYIHDYGELPVHVSGNAVLSARFNTLYAGTNGIAGGFICDGATISEYNNNEIGVKAYVSQMGAADFGHKSYMGIHNSFLANYGGSSDVTVAGNNDILNVYSTTFDSSGPSDTVDATAFSSLVNVHLFNSASADNQIPLIVAGGGIVPSANSPQMSSHYVCYGMDVPVVADQFYGRDSIDGAVADHYIRATDGFRSVVGGHTLTIFDSGGNSLIPGTATVSNSIVLGSSSSGLSSSATNTLSVAASGATNNTAVNYLVTITAGTGMSLKDGNGNGIISPVLNESFPLKPNWRLTGTAITGQAYQFP